VIPFVGNNIWQKGVFTTLFEGFFKEQHITPLC
jgi:hypothetical protein